MRARIGVDVGGTFTDVSLFDEDTGRLYVTKVPSTGHDQSIGIIEGITAILTDCGARPEDVIYLAHGTTVATNALLERKGARVGLLTTAGFADLLDIGRQKRPSLYDLFVDKPPPIVPRSQRQEVRERLSSDGSPLVPLDEESLEAALVQLASADIEAVAVCFLHSYVNPAHEQRAKAAVVARFPEVYTCASHDVAREFREYERFSTAVLNAYLGPVMRRYIRNLERRIAELGVRAEAFVTQSNGGVISLKTVVDAPSRTALSGPSAGVVGAAYVAGEAGYPNIITFDMGGTSTDVCLIKDGTPSVSSQRTIAGYPARVPMVDVHTIGAGGGSIAWLDATDALQVGPESAAAYPGPAAYGRGGNRPTVTDANVVLGRLNPCFLLSGRMAVDREAAERVIGQLADSLGASSVEAAMGIIRLVNSNMARAIRKVSVEKGEDPRQYVLVAFGGAGPVHAADLASEIGMTRILVPPRPGILCSMGLLATDLRSDYVRSRLLPAAPPSLAAVIQIFAEMESAADDWFKRESIPADGRHVIRSVDMRYKRQNFELKVEVPEGEFTVEVLERLTTAFQREHDKAYGFSDSAAACYFVNFRLTALGRTPKFPITFLPAGGGTPAPEALTATRPVFFPEAGGFVETPVYSRDRFLAGDRFAGPAIVEQLDTTAVVPPGWIVTVDPAGNLILEVGGS